MRTGTHATPPPAMTREEGVVLVGLVALFLVTAAWWALAFWPVQSAPEWLERTRYACFGATGSGLPNAGGWIGLTAGPFGMLLILLVGWSKGARDLARRARRSRAIAAVFAMLALGTMSLVLGAAARVQQARPALGPATHEIPPSTYPRLDRPAPQLALVAQDGQTHSLDALADRVVLVTFAYAHCTTVCPVVVSEALAAQSELEARGERPVVLVVTLDPWRDTPSRLPSMATSWNLPASDAWVLSGEVEEVERALDAWDVPRTRDVGTGEVVHPALTYIIDRSGRIAYATTGGVTGLVSLVERL